MALFERKSPYAKLVEDYHKLSPEDRKKFHAEILDVEKAEDEREIDKVEAEKAESPKKEDEKREEVKEESREIGKEINEAEETEAEDIEKGEEPSEEAEEAHKEEKPIEEVEELPKEEIEKERPLPADDRIDKLTELVNALAEKIDAVFLSSVIYCTSIFFPTSDNRFLSSYFFLSNSEYIASPKSSSSSSYSKNTNSNSP